MSKLTSKQIIIRKKWDEYNSLRKAKYSLGKITLEKPMFVGYKQCYVLTDFAKLQPNIDDIKRALDLVNITLYSKTKHFKPVDNDKYYSYYHNSGYPLKKISKKEYDSLPQTTKKLFNVNASFNIFHKDLNYSFTKPNAVFKLKISRHYITEVQILDTELESRMAEILNWIQSNNAWPVIYKLNDWSYYEDDYLNRKFRAIEKYNKKDMLSQIEEYKNSLSDNQKNNGFDNELF